MGVVAAPAAAAAKEPKPLGWPMMVAITAMTATMLASALSIVFDFHRIAVVNAIQSDVARGATYRFAADIAAAHTSDHQTAVAAIAEAVAILVAAIAFIFWFHRAYANLRRIGASGLRYRHGWAIAGWFVPFLSLVWPKRMANDIWRGSDPAAPPGRSVQYGSVPALFRWWWGAWLLDGVLGRIAVTVWNRSHTASAVKSATTLDVVSAGVSIAAAALSIAVLYRLSDRQTARIQVLAGAPAF